MALGGVAVANGLGLVTGKRWSQKITIVLSPILLLCRPASLFLIGSATGIWPLLVIVILFLIALSGLGIRLSIRGKRASEA